MDRNLTVTYEEQQSMQIPLGQQEKEKRAWIFKHLAPASLIYALVYTICGRNTVGVTIPVWIGVSVVYAVYAIHLFGEKVKRDSVFFAVLMLLLGISTFTTGDYVIIFLNRCAFFVLLAGFLLRNLSPEAVKWDFFAYAARITAAVYGAATEILKPITDGITFFEQRGKKKDGKGKYVLIGLCIAVPCVLLLGALLMTADLVFANLIRDMFSFRFPAHVFGNTVMLCFGFFSSYCGVRWAALGQKSKTDRSKLGEPVIAVTVTSLIAALYIVFCGIQIVYLFYGKMQLPEGMTYAEYARTGFFQLLFVCILNLFLVSGMEKYFKRNRILQVMLLVISFCTWIMTASSACRMILYIKAYGLTSLRVAVLFALADIALLTGGIIFHIVRPYFQLSGYGIAVTGVMYLLFSFAHVDNFVVSYNLDRAEQMAVEADYDYILGLSTDAAPAIKEHMNELPDYVVTAYLYQTETERQNITFWNFNVSHYVAYRLLDGESGGNHLFAEPKRQESSLSLSF